MAEAQKSPRLVQVGDVVRVDTVLGTNIEEVVREVQIIVVLGNGQAARLPMGELVTYLTRDDIPEDLVPQIEEMQSQDEAYVAAIMDANP